MAINDDPRVQEAFRLLAEVVQEQLVDEGTQAVFSGWHSTESRRSDFDFEVKVRTKDAYIRKRTREVEEQLKKQRSY